MNDQSSNTKAARFTGVQCVCASNLKVAFSRLRSKARGLALFVLLALLGMSLNLPAASLWPSGASQVEFTFENANNNIWEAITTDASGNNRTMQAGANSGNKWAGGALAPGSTKSIICSDYAAGWVLGNAGGMPTNNYQVSIYVSPEPNWPGPHGDMTIFYYDGVRLAYNSDTYTVTVNGNTLGTYTAGAAGLMIQKVNGVFSFWTCATGTTNWTQRGSDLADAVSGSSFASIHLFVQPGGGYNFWGYVDTFAVRNAVVTLTYNGNGNNGGNVPTDSNSPYVNGSTVTVLGNPGGLTKTNFNFGGWNAAADGSGINYTAGNTFTITSNTVLYAKWVTGYTVTYDANGGVNPPVDANSYVSGATVTVLGRGAMTRVGYGSSAWNTAANGSGTSYSAGSTFNIVSNTTLYAQWIANAGQTLTWTAAVSTNWDQTTANWTNNAGFTTWYNNSSAPNSALFDTTGAGPVNVSASLGTLYASNLTFNAAGYTIGGSALTLGNSPTIVANANVAIYAPLSGAGALTKTGPGTLRLTSTGVGGTPVNTYTGGTVIQGGTLEIYGRSADNGGYTSLGTGPVTINAGGTLVSSNDWATGNEWNGGNVGKVTVNQGGTWTINTAGNTVRNGLELNGGTVNGSGANSDWGALYLKSTSVTAGGNATSTVSVDTALDVNIPMTVESGSQLVYSGTIHNKINAAGGITKLGAGTLVLSDTNTYAGETIVQAGTLAVTGSLPAGSVLVRSNAVLLMNSPGLAAGGSLNLATGSTLTLAHGQTNLITRFYINGLPQAVGLWGAPGSGALNESALITGPGKLAVKGDLLVIDPVEGVNLANGGWSVEWETNGDVAGWGSNQVSSVAVSGGLFSGTATGSSPAIYVNNLNSADLDLGWNDYLEIRLQLPAGYSGPVFIDYGTANSVTSTGSPGFSSSRRLTIPAGVVRADGAFHTYQLDLGLEQEWRHTLNDLRIYPLGTNALAGQSFAIDYVRVGDVGPQPVQDGWMDFVGGIPYRAFSKHFVFGWDDRAVTDVGMNANWAHGNLRNAEEVWQVYVKKLGYLPPQNQGANKINFVCVYDGNWTYGGVSPMLQVSRYQLRIDPPSWTISHELMHVFQGVANGGFVPYEFAEFHANYGNERWLQHYQNLFPGETRFDPSVRGDMHLNQPVGRNYYLTWLLHVYCDLNPDNLPDLGEGTVVKLWRQMGPGEVNYSTLERLTPVSSVKDIVGLYARRGLTLNYPGTVLRNAVGLYVDTWGQLTEPVRRPDDPTWFQVPTERAPQQGAFTIHELTPTGSGAGRVVSVNFRGLGYGSGAGADWRASFIVIADDNSERYSPLWNLGTNSVTLAANENRVYLCVAATPDNWLFAGFDEPAQPFRSDLSKRRYPYEFQVWGATPKEGNHGTTNGGWVVHSNGGGLKAATASVDSTAYVGPLARVEDYARVGGNAQIRDNAIVRGHALVYENAVVSGNAIVSDFAQVHGSSTVSGDGRVFEHGHIWGATMVTDQAMVKGSAACWGGAITGNAMVDGDYWQARNVHNAEVCGHKPYNGVPDSFLNPLPSRLYAAYDFNSQDPVLAWDSYSPNEALLRGAPGWLASDAGQNGVLTLNGSNQWVQLPRAVAELRGMTLVTAVKWNGGANNQTLVQFGDGAARYLTFTPRNSSGVAELKISNGSGVYSVTALALTPGVWTQVGIALDGAVAAIHYNGVMAGSSPVPLQPQQVLPPNTRDNPVHNYLGRGETSFFNGAVDSFRVYSTAVPSGQLVKVEALPSAVRETSDPTTIRFSRSSWTGAATNGTLTLTYTVGGSATAGVDYVALLGSVTIPDGQTYVDVPFTPWADALSEGDQTVVISLQAAAGYTLSDSSSVTVTLQDTPPLSTALLGYYQFDETSGITAADSSGNNNTADLANGPVWIVAGGQPALTFDGGDDYVQTPVPNGGTRTLAAWIRPHNAGAWVSDPNVFSAHVAGQWGTGWGVRNGQIVVLLDDLAYDSGVSVTNNGWQHVTLTFNSTVARLYLNGTLKHVFYYTQGAVTAANYRIGHSLNADFPTAGFDGDVRDARIYNREVYGLEAQQIYQAQVPWAPSGLAALPESQQVTLTWAPAYLAESYSVERSTINGGPYTVVGSTSETTFTDVGLTNGVTYYYVVKGVNAAGTGPGSAPVSVMPQVIPAPGNGVWNNLAGGSWTNWGNWVSNIVAAGTDKKATFALGTPVTVSLDANRTVGFLAFSNANHTIGGSPTLTLDVSMGAPGVSVESNRIATIQSPVAGVDGLLKNGAGTLTLAAAASYSGTSTVANGTLVLNSTYASTSFAITTNAVLELNTASGDKDYGTATFSGAGTLRKTGASKAIWGSSVATFALGSGSAIDVLGGTLVGGSYGNENWTANKSDLNVAAGAIFEGVEANVRVDALSGAGVIQSGYSGAGYSAFTFGVDNGSGEFSGVLANNVAPGNFIKTGTGTQVLSGDCIYTGTTTISGGTLLVNGSLWTNTVTVASGATLGGSGIINGPVTVQSGGVLTPGASIGALTINHTLTLAANSQTRVELNASAGTNDAVRGLTTVNYGGTLMITNLAGAVAANQSFQLFSAANRTGNFSAITPTNAGAGLVWNFNPTNSVLTALATVALNPTNLTASVTGTNLTLSWPADHTGWTLLSQTNNLNLGVSANTNDWMRVLGSSTTNSVAIPILPTQPGGYYRLVYP